ncbi:hypothetical protein AVEN_223770-1 [Araneus ventricosus]|uniref:Uncharacterized protein n=1 Tax=Araneus ventricosus TaxID=182803 RepID=A0A4Y2DN33_ARAVE|nr:hypothetical protein AVEN_223770-1 [Araneus ventricosus]
MLGAVDTRWYPRAAFRVWSDQEDDEASARGSHSESFHDTIRFWGASCSINHFQKLCGSESSIKAACSCTAFNTETSATPSTVVPYQSDVEFHRLEKRGVQ